MYGRDHRLLGATSALVVREARIAWCLLQPVILQTLGYGPRGEGWAHPRYLQGEQKDVLQLQQGVEGIRLCSPRRHMDLWYECCDGHLPES
ncbi:hypothetical protein NDU88_007850 [Pleurodeles waltl]|uniref:Uncharacterized protein n=1 Tax=Pleurodeles waltl TaxID=8319 RepID=A0AAV7PQG8_PLEWA|nr:hypothetical protein NDU88_007850 [Pleurodeles waltl]